MSTRAAKTLSDDMESMQDTPPKELEAAQSELIRLAKTLIDSGDIAKPRKNGDSGSEFD
jgi:flagellar motor switch protein FliG